jgi:tetratricopeptide (TPR) repeat protein
LPRAYFIYGCPGETVETIDGTLALIDRIKPLSAIFYILDIFPGTDLYETYKKDTGVNDDIWLERKEDILYFESDPLLDADTIREFGGHLRSGFHQRLPGFALDIQLRDEPSLAAEQADFLSRLGLTFSHGDYAGIRTRPHPHQVADALFERALKLHPDHRAYWDKALLCQRQGRWREAETILQSGLEHFPCSPDLNICLATILMKAGENARALHHLRPFESHPQAMPMIARCRRIIGTK